MAIRKFKPEKIRGIRVGGKILDIKKNEFTFKVEPKNEENKKNLQRSYTVRNTSDNLFRKPFFENSPITLVYLTEESMKGLYKNPEMNLPYEILDINRYSIYRVSNKKKEKILSELEQAAIEEGLRD